MQPNLEHKLANKKWDITPYVNVFNTVPEAGFSQFMDSPRYSTGYTTLFNTLGMMVETHMLKPYKQRVEGTYELMKSMIEIIEEDHEQIKTLRLEANQKLLAKTTYPLQWEIDTTKTTTLQFKGFEGHRIPSNITEADRLKYDVNKPFTKPVAYQNYFKPSVEVSVPKAYIIPQGWWHVIELLKLNNVALKTLTKDTTITVQSYKIDAFETRTRAYEGHYQHYNTSIKASEEDILFRKGDFLIETNQTALGI